MSRNAVFYTQELLESVLGHLSPEDLLTTRHVSKQWYMLIRVSPTLRRKLFLLGQPIESHWLFDMDNAKLQAHPGTSTHPNTLITAKLNPWIFNGAPVKRLAHSPRDLLREREVQGISRFQPSWLAHPSHVLVSYVPFSYPITPVSH